MGKIIQEVFAMADYVIVTDNTADLPYSYYKEHGMEYKIGRAHV